MPATTRKTPRMLFTTVRRTRNSFRSVQAKRNLFHPADESKMGTLSFGRRAHRVKEVQSADVVKCRFCDADEASVRAEAADVQVDGRHDASAWFLTDDCSHGVISVERND